MDCIDIYGFTCDDYNENIQCIIDGKKCMVNFADNNPHGTNYFYVTNKLCVGKIDTILGKNIIMSSIDDNKYIQKPPILIEPIEHISRPFKFITSSDSLLQKRKRCAIQDNS